MKSNLHHIARAAAALVTTLLVTCTADSGARTDSAHGAHRSDSASAAAGVNVDANATPPSSVDSAPGGARYEASFSGIAPLRIGMSAAEARSALGMPASNTKDAEECHYLDDNGRLRIYVMVVRDTVARLDVRDNTTATEAGIRVGDAESRVTDAYRGRVTTQPHKYVRGGHYLIVRSPGDTTRALVFETDGKRVTSWRVGRTPEVHWVEGCS